MPYFDMNLSLKEVQFLNEASVHANSFISKRQTLKHRRSNLDLIDDTKLTSLPFPPPPPTRPVRKNPSLYYTSVLIAPNVSSDLEKEQCVHKELQGGCEEFIGDISQCSDVLDEDFHDPIILVEDYLSTESIDSNRELSLLRKKSLADFKNGMILKDGSLEKPNLRRPVVLPLKESPLKPCKQENLEDIFGSIPGIEQLKHCTLCDKPLYEVSSILTNVRSQSKHSRDLENKYFCEELVCFDCIEIYEYIVSMIQNSFNCGTSMWDKSKMKIESSLLSVINNLATDRATLSTFPIDTDKDKNLKFSQNLIKKLHHLIDVSNPDRNEKKSGLRLDTKTSWNSFLNLLLSSMGIKKSSG